MPEGELEMQEMREVLEEEDWLRWGVWGRHDLGNLLLK